MTGGESGLLERWYADMKQPAGGWTFGLLSLCFVLLGPVVSMFTWKPIGWLWMFGWLFIHMGWGAYGYYPRRI
jgi:hypothetical protein